MFVTVGLGNPGPRYSGTRHNAGFLVVEELARRQGASFRKAGRGTASREEASALLPAAEGLAQQKLLLVKPQSYMNVSGFPVQAVMARYRVSQRDLLVVHDDLDLPLGRLRFKQDGGAGGQRGVRDIIDRIGPDFLRLKVGVSRPPDGRDAQDWVLSRFTAGEKHLVEAVVAAAADAVETMLNAGLETAMNQTNGLDLAQAPG